MRTRRTAVAASALLLSLAVHTACGDDDGAGPEAEGTPSPSATQSASPSEPATPSPTETSPTETAPGDGTTKLTSRGLPQGSAPALAYVAADDAGDPAGSWSMVRPDGTSVALPLTGIHSMATLGDGAVVLVDDGEETAAVVVDGSGEEVSREESRGYRLATTTDGSVVAWLNRDLTTTVLGQDGTTLRLTEVPQAGEIGAVVGGDSCPDVDPDGYGCTAYLNGAQSAEVLFVDSHGMSGPGGGSLLRVADAAADGRLAGMTSVDDLGSCSSVLGAADAAVWETCDHTLTQFSPDGTRVLGTDAYLDGFGQRSVVFLDAADGTVLHQFLSRGRGATVLQTAWEDADHVLAVLYERGRWSVARLGVDGTMELAAGPVEGSDLDRPFVLQQD